MEQLNAEKAAKEEKENEIRRQLEKNEEEKNEILQVFLFLKWHWLTPATVAKHVAHLLVV